MPRQQWRCPPNKPLRVMFAVAEAWMLALWISALVEGGPQQHAALWGVMLFLVVPYVALAISIVHWSQMEKRFAPAQHHYRKIFWGALAVFALFVLWPTGGKDK